MKKIYISEKCMGCGSCFAMSNLVLEDEMGEAVPNLEILISSDNESEVKEIIKICPVSAISIVEEGLTNKTGLAGIKEIKEKSISKLSNYGELEIPKLEDIKFKENEYDISIPDAQGEYEHNYSSSSKAEKAAEDEFRRIMYSKIDVIIQKIVMEYKVKYIKPYYTCNDGEKNYYTVFNKKIEKILKNIVNEVYIVSKGKIIVPESFSKFNVFPDYSRYSLARMMEKNEIFNKEEVEKIRREFDSESYHKIAAYNEWDIDEREQYIGSGFFGDKYKYTYCYNRIYEACFKLAKDIMWCISFKDIDEDALYRVEQLIDDYNRNMKEELKRKINILNDYL